MKSFSSPLSALPTYKSMVDGAGTGGTGANVTKNSEVDGVNSGNALPVSTTKTDRAADDGAGSSAAGGVAAMACVGAGSATANGTQQW